MNQSSGDDGHRIVIGVDGPAPSKAALAWAIRRARCTGAAVDAVIAWEFPVNYGYPVPVACSGEAGREVAGEPVPGQPGGGIEGAWLLEQATGAAHHG